MAIPDAIRSGPFLLRQARAEGLSVDVLRGKRFRRLHPGVYACADLALTLPLRVAAARLLLPADAVVSHITALQLAGVDVGPAAPLHFSTRHQNQVRLEGVVCHRLTRPINRRFDGGLLMMCLEQAWVRASLMLPFVDRVIAADWLLRLGLTSLPALHSYTLGSREHGVRRARRTLRYVCERVDSPRETILRLILVFARLPAPVPNVWVGNDVDPLARSDLVYLAYKVVVEYDGEHHWRDRRQRERDIARREALERAGWTMVVVTAAGLTRPHEVVRRVHMALCERGYRGPEPVFSESWQRWFATGR